eukprot:188275-Rhodomonas_salina.1
MGRTWSCVSSQGALICPPKSEWVCAAECIAVANAISSTAQMVPNIATSSRIRENAITSGPSAR